MKRPILTSHRSPEPREALGVRAAPRGPSPSLPGPHGACPIELPECFTPGADEQRFVYDQIGRLVMSQDGNQRFDKKWRYFKYDDLNRPIASGLLNDPTNFNNLNYHRGLAEGLTGYPNTREIETDHQVIVHSPQADFVSKGLKANLNNGQYEFFNVRGKYAPKS